MLSASHGLPRATFTAFPQGQRDYHPPITGMEIWYKGIKQTAAQRSGVTRPRCNSKDVTEPEFKPELSYLQSPGLNQKTWGSETFLHVPLSAKDPTALGPTVLTFQGRKHSVTTNRTGEKQNNNQSGKNAKINMAQLMAIAKLNSEPTNTSINTSRAAIKDHREGRIILMSS